ncbi:MAG: M17 family peptidase N-terminal domain-containing protein, partial [bacterium]
MKLTGTKKPAHQAPADAVGVFWHEEQKPAAKSAFADAINELLSVGDFKGKASDTTVVPLKGAATRRLVLVGLGKREKVDASTWRKAGARLTSAARHKGYANVAVDSTSIKKDALQTVAAGMALANYEFTTFKKNEDKKPVESVTFAG